MSTTGPAKPSSAQTIAAASSSSHSHPKPPVTIHPTTHLDPGAYVRGTHAITLDSNSLIHPRAQLISAYGPLTIGSGTIIFEKAVLGGPVPVTPSTSSISAADVKNAAHPPVSAQVRGSEPGPSAEDTNPKHTMIGSNVSIQPHAQIHAGATLRKACTIESHAIIHSDVVIGEHAKVCACCLVERDVGDWEVVYGEGRQRRQRVAAEDVESKRVKAMSIEREVTTLALKAAAKAQVLRKR